MNPQDQDQPTSPLTDTGLDTPSTQPESPLSEPTTPSIAVPTSPEADAAALQAIESLESEGVTTPPITPVVPPSIDNIPAETPASQPFNPTPSITSPVPTEPQQQPDSSATPVEAAVVGVAAAPQAPVAQPAPSTFGAPKKTLSKRTLILITGVGVLVLLVAGFFIWQAMNPTTTTPASTNTTQTTDTTTGGDQPGGDETTVEPSDTAQ